ncbi:MAG TPA: LytTR family DNA-binding domain-containing protein [Polyangiaceae bacterium]|jgi:two-component system LytT family response regulator|nr:LytTR family DNA-binding domain-containing protein [Polyangiaceae bacterium]
MTDPNQPKTPVLVADDEEPARRLVAEYLGAHPGFHIVAEAKNGLEAVQLAKTHEPALLLLDVQMPKLDGFEVLGLLAPEVAVIFTTAFDEYAIRAFEVHAIDYLLKPFSRERFAQALARAEKRLGQARPVAAPELAQAARGPGAFLERLVIRDGTEILIIPAPSIDYVKGQDDYVEVVHDGRSSLTQQTLQSLENSLDPRQFVRVHRSYVVNVTRVARLEPWGQGSKLAVLHDGRTVPVSRSGEARLRAVLGV